MFSIKTAVAMLVLLGFATAVSLNSHDGDCPCPSGYSKKGNDCHQNCLDGWRDDGLFCRLAEYGRGAGYPWKFGDSLNDNGMRTRCERDNGAGNCEKWGAVIYPKCKTGYSTFGCCICRPAKPDCNALGFNGGIDLSCAKKIIINPQC